MFILTSENNIIVAVLDTATMTDEGVVSGEDLYSFQDMQLFEVTEDIGDVAPYKYFYTEEGFKLNEQYAGQLEEVKKTKLEDLRQRCKEHILGYFSATVGEKEYAFSFDLEAQMNFNGTLQFFNGKQITSVSWTAYDNGRAVRVELDEQAFRAVADKAFAHNNDAVSKLRDTLQPLVESAKTIEEVSAINW